MNMAQLWKFPVIYVCENNQYNEYTHHSETTAGSMTARAEAFGIHAVEVDGQDIREVHLTMQTLVERARQSKAPAFMLCHTYRFKGHHVGDINRAYYRSKEEEQHWTTNKIRSRCCQPGCIEQQLTEAQIFEQIKRRCGRS